jgi:hypothetical protein
LDARTKKIIAAIAAKPPTAPTTAPAIVPPETPEPPFCDSDEVEVAVAVGFVSETVIVFTIPATV